MEEKFMLQTQWDWAVSIKQNTFVFFVLLLLLCETSFDCMQYFTFIFTNFFPPISDCLLELDMQQHDYEIENGLDSSMNEEKEPKHRKITKNSKEDERKPKQVKQKKKQAKQRKKNLKVIKKDSLHQERWRRGKYTLHSTTF